MHILRSCNTTVYIFIKVSSSVLKMLHLVVILRDGQGEFYISPKNLCMWGEWAYGIRTWLNLMLQTNELCTSNQSSSLKVWPVLHCKDMFNWSLSCICRFSVCGIGMNWINKIVLIFCLFIVFSKLNITCQHHCLFRYLFQQTKVNADYYTDNNWSFVSTFTTWMEVVHTKSIQMYH